MHKLILPKYKKTYPNMVRNELYTILNLMSRTENYDLYVYCLLKALYDLLLRYETTCRETIFIAELEKDESKMRKKIINLQKQTLYDELSVLGFSFENIDI